MGFPQALWGEKPKDGFPQKFLHIPQPPVKKFRIENYELENFWVFLSLRGSEARKCHWGAIRSLASLSEGGARRAEGVS